MDEQVAALEFFMIPKAVVKSGILARMYHADLKVYLVICLYRNYKTNKAYPSVERICREAGVNKDSAYASIKRLQISGLIVKYRAPKGLKFKNVYTVFQNPDIDVDIYPSRSDKRKPQYREKSGKWGVCPSEREKTSCPSEREKVSCPSDSDSKENEQIGNRVSFKEEQSLITISEETIRELEKTKGKAWVSKMIKQYGYTVSRSPSTKGGSIAQGSE